MTAAGHLGGELVIGKRPGLHQVRFTQLSRARVCMLTDRDGIPFGPRGA